MLPMLKSPLKSPGKRVMKRIDLQKLYEERVRYFTQLSQDWESRANAATTNHYRGVCLGKARDYRHQARSYARRLERLDQKK